MTYNQFMNVFGWDFHLEYIADMDYWDSHEGSWDEYTRSEYRKYCNRKGYQVVFD